jgi:hypothetical protein
MLTGRVLATVVDVRKDEQVNSWIKKTANAAVHLISAKQALIAVRNGFPVVQIISQPHDMAS